MISADQIRADGARALGTFPPKTGSKELLTTKEVATLTGFSTSYFEKGRIYAYGPKFLRGGGAGRNGKILYRRADVEAWLASQECDPEVARHV
ncbi:helix-turn-helix transcriptional regulator [Rhodovulum kholense]|uniref:Helix-turn-helix protein n=1 Tax=Rhodovulum kholense TaxID=453584 RepID=A0A8E2VKQ7_9RHOB|nr:helix-turn-helix domain-containing protein [Rhodovulum kholense]PTW50584.1 hypothetical protein C8N38_104220 [Rhodovulum kholense]